MNTRKAAAKWTGTLKSGKGTMSFSNYEGPFTFKSRFEEGDGTNPEELVGAALSGCFSMYLSSLISKEDIEPESIETIAKVNLDSDGNGPAITSIDLKCEVRAKGLNEELFEKLTQQTKAECPISKLYKGTTINLDAKLLQTA